MVRLANLAIGLIVAGVASAAEICGSEEECNKMCENNWEKGYICERYSAKQRACEGCVTFRCMTRTQVPYRNPLDGKMACCPADTHFEFNSDVKKGKCCPNGQYLSLDPKAKAVGCCPQGTPKHSFFVDPANGDSSCCEATAIGYIDGKCVMPEQPKPPTPEPKPEPKPKPADECGHKVCPPDEHDMGVEYGKCYRLISAVTGFPLSVPRSDYRFDVKNPIWQFRVCRSTKDCSPGGTVKSDEKFVLNDVIGAPNNKEPGPWWMCKGVHHYPCLNEKIAKQFSAKKWCTSEGCGICIAADPNGLGGVCPGQASLGDTNNPRNCMPFIVEEMPCLAKNPLAPAVEAKEAASFEAASARAAPETDGEEFEFEFEDLEGAKEEL